MIKLPGDTKHARSLLTAVVITSAMALGSFRVAAAQDGGVPTPTPEPIGEEPAAPVEVAACAECHPDVVAAWQGEPHAMAYEDPLFQAGWESQDFDPSCLQCHTSGFIQGANTYRAEGITCEECHGVTPGGHPPEPVDLNRANQGCTDCHLVTQAEFRASVHADEGLVCTSCHYAHNNGLRLATEVDQCLGCHDHQLDDFAHRSHIESDLTCRDCHGYVSPGLDVPPDGLGPTGHDFQVNMTACLDCHQDIDLEVVNGQDGEGGFTTGETRARVTGGQQAELRAAQLEAVVETLVLQQRNQMTVSMAQGGVGGLLVGSLGLWLFTPQKDGKTGLGRLFSRRAKRSGQKGADDEE